MRRQTDLARRVIEMGGGEALVEASLIWMFTPRFFEVGREVIDQLVSAFFAGSGPEPATPEVLLAQLDAINKHDVLADLGRIECPTLVAGGKMDVMVPGYAAEEIAAAIPNAELAMFETGHGLIVEEMEAFNQRLAAFLKATN